ncbi:spermine oxidase-like [Sabethes cyaneus]|uniref:spermine oxidase-like n=1 Tax=Sabethes cyaneus TaxID=53552 RepID=UPI00237D9C8B|nr:spermine oxidase-like [Sabethes cyaneus]
MNDRIVIIGAGSAGIAAAAKLVQHGFKNLEILEASDRIGGRIRTVPFGQSVVELGAQWCHGAKNNAVYEMANPHGHLEKSRFTNGNVMLFSDGTRVPSDLTKRLQTLADQLMSGPEIQQSTETLGDYFVNAFKRKITESRDLNSIDENLVEKFIVFYHNYLKGYLAIDSWQNLTAANSIDYEECEGILRMNWKGKGFITILDLLMKQQTTLNVYKSLLDGQIKFNQKVTRITVSLGVLKEKMRSLFLPELTESKLNAIQGLHFGTVNKAFMEFEYPFWEKHGNVFRLLWNQDSLEEVRASQYKWVEGVSSFFCVDNNPNVLAAWLVGQEGLMAEYLTDDAVQEGLLMILRKFFTGIDIPKPIGFFRSTWHTDPNTLGSYSSRSLLTEKLSTGAADLSEPIANPAGKPVILFAGEATSPNHWSTVHGAIETGWREADRIFNYITSNELLHPKILIIGAGAAGIAAATRLYEGGFRDLTILEAENRIGGRIHTIPYGENVLDCGAQWVHSKTDNIVYDMAAKYDLLEINSHRENELCIKSNGEEVPLELSNQILDLLTSSNEDVEKLKSYQKSLGDYYTECFQEALQSGKFGHIDTQTCYQVFDFFRKYHTTYNAVDSLYEVSAPGLLEFTDYQDEYLINWKTRGFKTILDILMKCLPEQKATPIPLEDFTLFNKHVSQIHYAANPDHPVRVTCLDGSSYFADHVIITVSLGVLKEIHNTLFSPKLPLLKVNAIEGLYIGTVDKMVLEFDTPFWPNGWRGFGILWNKEDLDKLRQTDKRWTESICSFFVPEHQPNMLVGWIYGKDARTMEALSEEKVIEGLLFILRKFLIRYSIPEPKSFKRTTWYSNKNFRGAYTSRSVVSDILDCKAADLGMPLFNANGKPVVQFAGEATHPEYYSTVQGAIGSGWREADRLVDLYKNKQMTIKYSKL